ncbi:hypothetical protein INR49_005283, partial [Caranx melampygus]
MMLQPLCVATQSGRSHERAGRECLPSLSASVIVTFTCARAIIMPIHSRMLSIRMNKAAESSGQARPVSAPAPNQPQKTQGSPEDLKCGVCCRTFVRSSYIRLQIRLKKGLRPYHCKLSNIDLRLSSVKPIFPTEP